MTKRHATEKGFAMLFTVLIVTLILSIAISISSISYKQTLLSNLAKDSQAAYFQADSGTECIMYYDITQNAFPLGTTPGSAPTPLACGDNTLSLNAAASSTNYFVYQENLSDQSKPCYSASIDKASVANTTIVQSRGDNQCQATTHQVERSLVVTY